MIKSYLFTDGKVREDINLDNWRQMAAGENDMLWVDVRAYSEEEVNTLARQFGLHSLAVEALLDGYARPHLYDFQDHFYVNMTIVSIKGKNSHAMQPSELHLFAGEKFVIAAYRETECEAVKAAVKEFLDTPKLAQKGPIYAVYLLAEDLVESYYPIVEKLDEEADKLEDKMMDKADKQSLKRLFNLKREAFELRRLLGPQRDIFNELSRRDFSYIQGEDQVYFQDIYNRMIRLFDMLDTIREILSGNLDIYLSTVSNRLNEIMKVLTVWSIILMALSFITGFYGMNFTNLPFLTAPNAFRNVTLTMVAIILGMLWWFRKKGWV